MTTSPQELFKGAFLTEIAEAEERSPSYPVETWKASGRATKEWPDKRNQDWWLTEGPGIVAKYIEWRESTGWDIAEFYNEFSDPSGGVSLPAIELELKGKVGGYDTIAYVDSVFALPSGELLVLDVKTGRLPSDEHRQLGLYAHLIEANFGTRPRWGGYWGPDKGFVGPYPLDHWTEAVLWEAFQDAGERIQKGIFPPNPKDNCKSWCSVADHCAIVGGVNAEGVDPLWPAIHSGSLYPDTNEEK